MKAEREIAAVIAEMLLLGSPELEDRLEAQAEELLEKECIVPAIGRLVDAYDIKLLFSALALKDEDFAIKFPGIAHAALLERHKLINTIEAHFERCTHCYLKRGYDLELDTGIKNICWENRDFLLQLLKEDVSDPSDDGPHALSAHT